MRVTATSGTQVEAPAKQIRLQFCGMQQIFGSSERIALWTALDGFSGFRGNDWVSLRARSTYSEWTLLKWGFQVPNASGWQKGQIFEPEAAK